MLQRLVFAVCLVVVTSLLCLGGAVLESPLVGAAAPLQDGSAQVSAPGARSRFVGYWDGGRGLFRSLLGQPTTLAATIVRESSGGAILRLDSVGDDRAAVEDLFGLRTTTVTPIGSYAFDEASGVARSEQGSLRVTQSADGLHVEPMGDLADENPARATTLVSTQGLEGVSLARLVLGSGGDYLSQFFAEYLRLVVANIPPPLVMAVVICAALAWLLPRRRGARAIQARSTPPGQLKREIGIALPGFVQGGAVFVLVSVLHYCGFSRMYGDVQAYGLPYFFLSLVIMALVQDAVFYWTHRLMHTGFLYERWHRLHHETITPTPSSAFAVAPQELVLHYGFVFLAVVFIPLHIGAFGLFFLLATVRNAVGHMGVEIFPGQCAKGPLAALTTVTHHDMHHEENGCNYGLYFRHWDLWGKTEHPDYLARFANTLNRGRATQSAVQHSSGS